MTTLSFEKWTQRASRALFYMRYEAEQSGSPSAECEHLLLGVWHEHGGELLFPAGRPTLEEIRAEIEQQKPRGKLLPQTVDMPLSRECQRAIAFAAEEALRMTHDYVGTGHLLVGLLREENSLAAGLLRAHGITLDGARKNLEEEDLPGTIG